MCCFAFGISIDVRIAGGLIIVSSGFSLLSGKFAKKRNQQKSETERSIEMILPCCHPMLAGPGSYRSNCFLSRTQQLPQKSSFLRYHLSIAVTIFYHFLAAPIILVG
jgi:small neutral amino acid transporter SnatA (MarC family)